jgi:hypothetical protein
MPSRADRASDTTRCECRKTVISLIAPAARRTNLGPVAARIFRSASADRPVPGGNHDSALPVRGAGVARRHRGCAPRVRLNFLGTRDRMHRYSRPHTPAAPRPFARAATAGYGCGQRLAMRAWARPRESAGVASTLHRCLGSRQVFSANSWRRVIGVASRRSTAAPLICSCRFAIASARSV